MKVAKVSNLITVKKFAEQYDVPKNNIYVVSHNQNPSWIKKIGTTMMIDEEYLLEHQKYVKKLWLAAHDYYYYFTHVLQVKQYFLAKVIARFLNESTTSWNEYMQSSLFKTIEKSLIHTTISKQLLKFVEFSEIFIQKIHAITRRQGKYQDFLKDMV